MILNTTKLIAFAEFATQAFYKDACKNLNSYGTLIFIKRNGRPLRDLKYIYYFDELENIYKEKSYIKLDKFGRIPLDEQYFWYPYDDNGLEELYDIFVYSYNSDFEGLEIHLDGGSFIETISGYPKYFVDITDPVDVKEIINLVEFGQFEKSFINLPSSTDFKANQVRFKNNQNSLIEPLTKNIFYELIKFNNNDQFEDFVTIKMFAVNEAVIESSPKNYLDVKFNNINPLIVPQHRFVSMRFSNATLFDSDIVNNLIVQKIFTISFYAKTNSNESFDLSLYLHRVFGIDSLSSREVPIDISFEGEKNVNKDWKKFIWTCSVGVEFFGRLGDFPINECYLCIKLPSDTRDIQITNLFVFIGELNNFVYPKKQTTTQFEDMFILNKPQLLMQTTSGIIPINTIGKIEDYAFNVGDKIHSVRANGRIAKIKDYYEYDDGIVKSRIPWKSLFDVVGHGELVPDHFSSFTTSDINVAIASQNAIKSNVGHIILQRNYAGFVKSTDIKDFFDVGNSSTLFQINWLSYGHNGLENLEIKTKFIFNKEQDDISVGVISDSIKDVNYPTTHFIVDYKSRYHQVAVNYYNNAKNEDVTYNVSNGYQKNIGILGAKRFAEAKVVEKNYGNDLVAHYYNIADVNSTTIKYQASFRIGLDEVLMPTQISDVYKKNSTPAYISWTSKSEEGKDSWLEKIILYNKHLKIQSDVNLKALAYKFQIEGNVALGLKLTIADETSKSNYLGKYFYLKSKLGTFKYWFKTTQLDIEPIDATNPTIIQSVPIDISNKNDGIDKNVATIMMKAINDTYIFCIPNLQDSYLYALGKGVQASKYALPNINETFYNASLSTLEGDFGQCTSNNLTKKDNFIFGGLQAGETIINVSTTALSIGGMDPMMNSFTQNIPSIATIRHISLV